MEQASSFKFSKEDIEKIKTIFLKPSVRKLHYLYTGVVNQPDTFILGNRKEDKFSYGDPEQSAAILKIKDKPTLAVVGRFFHAFNIRPHENIIQIIDVSKLLAIAAKYKNDLSNIQIDKSDALDYVIKSKTDLSIPPVNIGGDVVSHFTYLCIKSIVHHLNVTFNNRECTFLYKYKVKEVIPYKLIITHDEFPDGPVKKLVKDKIRCLVYPGIEAFVLPAEPEEYGILFKRWDDTLIYGGYVNTNEFELYACRIYFSLTCIPAF